MITTEEEQFRRSGIYNYYYGGVTNVINLRLTEEQVAVLSSGNNIADTVNSIINPNVKNEHDE
jgi:hypothetical protein